MLGCVRRAEASQTLTTPTALCAATPPQEEGKSLRTAFPLTAFFLIESLPQFAE